jgi:prophage DNA circulation protein
MAYQDRLKSASYKGVRFDVEAIEEDGGRRLQIDEIPLRDRAFIGDLGRAIRRFSFDAILIGDDYLDRADALQAACSERALPGPLIHPALGLISVHCESSRRRDWSGEMRMARFALGFIEVENVPSLTKTTSATGAVDKTATALQDAAQASLADELVVDHVPDQYLTAASAEVQKAGGILAALGALGEIPDKAAQLAANAAALIIDAQNLVLFPTVLAERLRAAVELVYDTASNAIDSLYAYQKIAHIVPENFSSSAVAGNAIAVTDLVRAAALAGWAKSAARVSWASYEDALAARRALELEIDSLADHAGDLVYGQLQTLRGAIGRALPPPGADLPRIRRITLPAATPGLVLSYRLYDDVTREAELVARNHVRNPGAVPGGVPLQVLSRA